MKNFTLICSAQGDMKQGIQPSDSDVYKSIADNTCYKFYPSISQEDLMQYHALQHISGEKGIYELKNKITFSSSQLFGNNQSDCKCEISKVEFGTLDLGSHLSIASDINTKRSVVVSQLPYIEGISLRDLFFLCKNDAQFLFIQEILVFMNNYYQKTFGFNMNHVSDLSGELNAIQLQGINIKISAYKDGTLYLTITDLAKNINEFVINNKFLVKNILYN